MIKSKSVWVLSDNEQATSVNLNHHLSPAIQQLVINRKLATVETIDHFFENEDLHNPFAFSKMNEVVTRINKAIEEGEPILVYGDYDADGVTATSILMSTLTQLGAMVEYYIPNRFTEGYGPNEDAFMNAIGEGYQLIITVDNGVSGILEADILSEHGVDLIITDHHQPKETTPNAFAILHPELDQNYPFNKLCGAGVALKLAQALLGDELDEDYFAIAMLGTIGDVVPLVGENRSIVKKGLRQLRVTTHPGLVALMESGGTKQDEVTETNIGFELCPRLNAPGRMHEAGLSVELLTAEDEEVAKELAKQIESLNSERQQETQTVLAEAIAAVTPEDLLHKKVILIYKNDWHEGILGIVAGRLSKQWQKAVFVLSDDHEGNVKGSGRAVDGYHLFNLLNQCDELIEKYGGHALAAGISLLPENLKPLEDKLNELMKSTVLLPTITVDLNLDLDDVDLKLVEDFNQLAPFGEGNRPPLIQLNNVQIKDVKTIGNKAQHLKFSIIKEKSVVDVIGFNLSHLSVYLTTETLFDVIGELKINEWNGKRLVQLQLQDLRCDEFQLIDMRNARVYQEFETQIATPIKYSEITKENTEVKNLIIDKIPESKDRLMETISNLKPENIILAPLPSEVTFPSRDKFISVYKVLKQKNTFALSPEVFQYFHQTGIVKNELLFILQVFFEVELAIIRNGSVFCADSNHKRDLSDAPIYQSQQQKVLMFEFLELTTWRDMKTAFINAREEYSHES
ncbi:MAG: single-stranded-DNA-specific exonuclease RecJ [Turicibacter sp.]